MTDVSHSLSAVASRSLAKAQSFVADNALDDKAKAGGREGGVKAYGSYEELYRDEVRRGDARPLSV